MKNLSSKDNDIIKQLVRLLSSKKERNDKGLFVVEGLRAVSEILKCNVKIISTFLTKEVLDKNDDVINKVLTMSNDYYVITNEIANKITDTKTPQGIFCLCEMPQSLFQLKENGKYILLCSLQDPGNIGTIIRSCDAFSVDGLLMTADCPDIFSPKVLRSTMGTVFRLPIKIYSNAMKACEDLKLNGIKIYAAALSDESINLDKVNLSSSACVMIGNEGNGLSKDEIELADEKIIIPMNKNSESLNAAIAASIFAWEMSKNE